MVNLLGPYLVFWTWYKSAILGLKMILSNVGIFWIVSYNLVTNCNQDKIYFHFQSWTSGRVTTWDQVLEQVGRHSIISFILIGPEETAIISDSHQRSHPKISFCFYLQLYNVLHSISTCIWQWKFSKVLMCAFEPCELPICESDPNDETHQMSKIEQNGFIGFIY